MRAINLIDRYNKILDLQAFLKCIWFGLFLLLFVGKALAIENYLPKGQSSVIVHSEYLVDEDNKTIYLYEQWDSKEEHQAYLNWRMETGFGDFMGEILEGEFSLSYLSNIGA